MKSSSLLRKKILSARDALSLLSRQRKSFEIVQKILLLEEIAKAETLFLYVDFRSEVKTSFLISKLLQLSKRVLVPVTLVQEKKLLPIAISDPEKDLVPGFCSILEPCREIRQSRVVAASEVDVILVPGSVFDEHGGRLGYGGGYYDRFMAYDAPQARRIGLAFELQIVDRLSLQPHDELLDLIVTEKRIIKNSR